MLKALRVAVRTDLKPAVGDGAVWIWHRVEGRWAGAHQLPDFHHASQHVWAVGAILHPENETARRGGAGAVLRCEQNYFATHAGRMNYQSVAERGWPIGSGAVESACAQKQGCCKRAGQFWTEAGLRHLNALLEARDHGHWDELWLAA